jgi:lipopolysaccharide/colanic/teichoic acid biosynthesis glycosyltransferase
MSLVDSDMSQPADGTQAGPRAGGVGYGRWKPALDRVAAMALLLLTAPIVIVAMALVRLTSRGPALYTQERLGLGGEVFTIYKIRTMHQDSERHGGATWSLPGDPRITPVGRVLRSSHLDELPQLINVLLGEISSRGSSAPSPTTAAGWPSAPGSPGWPRSSSRPTPAWRASGASWPTTSPTWTA